MPATAPLDFYADAGLVTRLGSELTLIVATPGASADVRFYIGSAESAGAYKAASNPGVDQVELALLPSAEIAAGDVRLATTQAGLDAATPGAPLGLGVSVDAAAPQEVWLRFTDASGVSGSYSGARLVLTQTEFWAA